MSQPTGPSFRRRRLARQLQVLREATGLNITQVAEQAGFSQSKISRVESATIGIASDDVRTLCELYGLDSSQTEEYAKLARDARRRGWWMDYGNVAPATSVHWAEIEDLARKVLTSEIAVVPGLLQTEEYALAVVRASAPDEPDDVITRQVELRMRRQRRLMSGELELWAVIWEPVLKCLVGGAEVMRAQLKHLVRMAQLPNVELQVMSLRNGEHMAMGTPFALAQLDDGPGPVVVAVDHVTGILYLEGSPDVERYTLAFRHLSANAQGTRQTLAAVHQSLADLADL